MSATSGIAFTGATGASFSTPSISALQITGNIDVRVEMTLTNWASGASQKALAKWNGGGGEYLLAMNANGSIQFACWGTTQTYIVANSAVAGFANGSRHWIRATRNITTGGVAISHGTDGTNWTTLSTFTLATGAVTASAKNVFIGTDSDGGFQPNGTIHRAQVLNGIAGTVVADMNPALVNRTGVRTPTSFTDAYNLLWSGAGTAWDWAASPRDVLTGSSDSFSGGSDALSGNSDVFSGNTDSF